MLSQGTRRTVQLGKSIDALCIYSPLALISKVKHTTQIIRIPSGVHDIWGPYHPGSNPLCHLPRSLLPCVLFASSNETVATSRAVLSTELKFVYLVFGMVWACGRCYSCLHYCFDFPVNLNYFEILKNARHVLNDSNSGVQIEPLHKSYYGPCPYSLSLRFH